MDTFSLLLSAAKFVLLLTGLLGPGAALMRALQIPVTIATSFAGSVFILYATVLAFQFTGLPIAFASLVIALVLLFGVLIWIGKLRAHFATGVTTPGSTSPHAPRVATSPSLLRLAVASRESWSVLWLILLAAFWAIVLWRAWHEPLAGPDTEFRWSYLAEQMLRLGTLDFYPPRRAEDFTAYFWAESIPPGASALHAWAYACAGETRPGWTAPAVVLQVWAVHEFIGRAAHRIGGVHAARCALLAAAACPLLTWSILLGQETGLTALSIAGVAFALSEGKGSVELNAAIFAAICAVIGAMAREYGLVFPILAAAGLALRRANCRAWLAFVVVASLSFAWPLRTWWLTGNPFYSLILGSFPTNPRFIAWIEHDAAALGDVVRSFQGWSDIVRYVTLFAPVAWLGWAAILNASLRGSRSGWWALVASAGVLTLWLLSVRYTNGGLFYSMRVASPALAVAALAAGIGLARIAENSKRRAIGSTAALCLVVVFTLPATYALPRNPWRSPPPVTTPAGAASAAAPGEPVDPTVGIVGRDGGAGSVVLADAPGFQRRFAAINTAVVPLWSPQADGLFDLELSVDEAVRRLKQSGVRYVVLTKWKSNLDFFNERSLWARPPFEVQSIGETATTAVFRIRIPE